MYIYSIVCVRVHICVVLRVFYQKNHSHAIVFPFQSNHLRFLLFRVIHYSSI